VESATAGIIANAPKLKNVPVLQIFGDYVDQHPRWAGFKKSDMVYGDAFRAAGGTADWINLPDIDADGGQEQRSGRRSHTEMAGRQGPLGLSVLQRTVRA
jgi:hypothetical protein